MGIWSCKRLVSRILLRTSCIPLRLVYPLSNVITIWAWVTGACQRVCNMEHAIWSLENTCLYVFLPVEFALGSALTLS